MGEVVIMGFRAKIHFRLRRTFERGFANDPT